MMSQASPSSHIPGRGRIYGSITETIGDTPIVRLDRLAKAKGVHANLLAKLEFFNPISSVKFFRGRYVVCAYPAWLHQRGNHVACACWKTPCPTVPNSKLANAFPVFGVNGNSVPVIRYCPEGSVACSELYRVRISS